MDFALPADLVAYLAELDRFIAREIKPIEDADDNIRFWTTAANGRAPISKMAGFRGMNGKRCCDE